MTLLTFQEMRESSKRFGVNEVTKRRNSFNENHKGGNKNLKRETTMVKVRIIRMKMTMAMVPKIKKPNLKSRRNRFN